MGGLVGKCPLIDRECKTWAKQHSLNTNSEASVRFQELARLHFAVGTKVQLCQRGRSFDNRLRKAQPSTREALVTWHYFITSGDWLVELRWDPLTDDGCVEVRECSAEQSAGDNAVYEVEKFAIDEKQLERICAVVGATNHSLALRNSEHVARYIHSGAWVSMQTLPEGDIGKALHKHMGAEAKKLLSSLRPPVELDVADSSPTPIFPGQSGYIELVNRGKKGLTAEDEDAFNIVVIGPTGSGKSSIINRLFNAIVTKQACSVQSVQRHMVVLEGTAEILTYDKDQPYKRRKVNVVDTIGFCDSAMKPEEVVELIKQWLKVQKAMIDKVIVVVSGRIEQAHATSITKMMQWLDFKSHRQNFLFVYNKADHVDDKAILMQNLQAMSEKLGTGFVQLHCTAGSAHGGQQKVFSLNLPLGIPPDATYEEAHEALQKLAIPLFSDVKTGRCLADTSRCIIL